MLIMNDNIYVNYALLYFTAIVFLKHIINKRIQMIKL